MIFQIPMVARTTSEGWIISHRCSWIMVYVFCRNARVNLIVILVTYVRYLYSINYPTVICLPSMLLFILWRDTTSELWTPVQFPLHCYYRLLLLALFTFTHTITFYHSICSILCLQQTGEIDNLIVSWGKVLGCVVCKFHVAAGAKQSPGRGAL
jgi:hypothetical protein